MPYLITFKSYLKNIWRQQQKNGCCALPFSLPMKSWTEEEPWRGGQPPMISFCAVNNKFLNFQCENTVKLALSNNQLQLPIVIGSCTFASSFIELVIYFIMKQGLLGDLYSNLPYYVVCSLHQMIKNPLHLQQ